jgi:tRNA-dihydrouridine synthase B
MKIKNLDFGENAIFLSPMAGVADFSYRALCREYGADFSFTEMVSCKGLLYDSERTNKMLFTLEQEKFCGIQLFGSEPEDFAKVVKMPQLEKFDIIDINFGCPAQKVFKNGEGSALLQYPQRVYEIVKAAVSNTKKPVTAKIRLGINEENFNGPEIARLIEKAGASAIFVHGRYREQQYSGKVDYELIKKIKQSVSIPVIGNGDITDLESLQKMRDTGVDAVSLARASMGKPWIFASLKGKELEIAPYGVFKRYVEKLKLQFSEEFLSKYLRKHALWYLKGYNSIEVKTKVASAESVEELLKDMEEFFKNKAKDV